AQAATTTAFQNSQLVCSCPTTKSIIGCSTDDSSQFQAADTAEVIPVQTAVTVSRSHVQAAPTTVVMKSPIACRTGWMVPVHTSEMNPEMAFQAGWIAASHSQVKTAPSPLTARISGATRIVNKIANRTRAASPMASNTGWITVDHSQVNHWPTACTAATTPSQAA